jgi:aspartyl/asparaginyl-tRNA synthetase
MERQISEMGIDCLDLVKRMLSGEMTAEQKYIGMRELHRKYPHSGFGIGAEQFANKWLGRQDRLPYKDDEVER